MLQKLSFEEDFYQVYKKAPGKIVVYGAGKSLKEFYEKLPKPDVICDKNAENIGTFCGQKVYEPQFLQSLCEKIYIIVCIADSTIFEEVYNQLEEYKLDAVVANFFENIAFGYNYGRTAKAFKKQMYNRKLKVNIVCQEREWIYKKFADKMMENLTDESLEIMISKDTREDVDINHHIPCLNYTPYPNDTMMISHIDDNRKIQILKKQLQTARLGICMSKETMDKLVLYGIPRTKLCYINPAQDNVICPKKYAIGITHRCYDQYDLRKRTTALLDILEIVDPKYFRFVIMGAGWNEIISKMREYNFEVTYYENFNYEKYIMLMNEIDYYLFMGMDEGSMGFLDALSAGVGTIVTPQGFHLDVDCEIDYPCKTVKQFQEALLDLQNKRKRKVEAVLEWTWKNYANKHLEIWDYIMKRNDLKSIYQNQMFYEDGIFSVLLDDCRI